MTERGAKLVLNKEALELIVKKQVAPVSVTEKGTRLVMSSTHPRQTQVHE